MKLKNAVAISVCGFIYLNSAFGGEALIKRNLHSRFPNITIKSITKTQYRGLYEVFANGSLAYTDENADYILFGTLLDVKTKKNISAERLVELNNVPFRSLPLQSAIKIVKGNGKRKMAVFTDPDCPFCHQLEGELRNVKNVTIYNFLYPIASLHPRAPDKARAIWCAKNQAIAWENWMQKGVLPHDKGNCFTPIRQIAQLGSALKIDGTPTIIFVDGRRISGVIPSPQIEKLLNMALYK